jgi:hypothetical protein
MFAGFVPSTFWFGAIQSSLIDCSKIVEFNDAGLLATLAIGSISKKFEKAAFCPEAFAKRIA